MDLKKKLFIVPKNQIIHLLEQTFNNPFIKVDLKNLLIFKNLLNDLITRESKPLNFGVYSNLCN